jgi:hypothetical protein
MRSPLPPALSLFPFLFLAACGGGGSSAGEPAPPVTQTLGCTAWFSANTPVGRLSNNVWNKQAAGSFPARQCLEQRAADGALQCGWSWTWPTPGTAIYAYPGIIVGAKPWEPGPGSDRRFPRQVSATNRLLVSYDVDTVTTGDHNLAASIWLIRTPTVANPPGTAAIATEMMFWTWSTPASFVPGGTQRDEVTVDGITWEVWAAEDWGDNSGANGNRWTYIAYRAKTPTRSITFDARKLMADAAGRGLLDTSHYIANVELGNEILSGTGTTFLRSFSMTVDGPAGARATPAPRPR